MASQLCGHGYARAYDLLARARFPRAEARLRSVRPVSRSEDDLRREADARWAREDNRRRALAGPGAKPRSTVEIVLIVLGCGVLFALLIVLVAFGLLTYACSKH